MASRFQAAALVAAPSYPNAVAWSDENFLAVASDNLVVILNPALPSGPRGLIIVPNCEQPCPFGVVKREDLLRGCMLPISLRRDHHPCVRSISWSPIGMAPNSGCLLAICTAEGRVKIYRPPFCDFGTEWIEVMDISEMLYDYLASTKFGEVDTCDEFSNDEATEHACIRDMPNSRPRRKPKQRRLDLSGEINNDSRSSNDVNSCSSPTIETTMVSEVNSEKQKKNNFQRILSSSISRGKSANKIPDNWTPPLITADQYASYSAMLHSLVVAWSPVLRLSSKHYPTQNGPSNQFSILAVGGRSGKISFWRIPFPNCYSTEHGEIPSTVVLTGLLQAHNSWVTTISWALLSSDSSNPHILLVTGSSDGSVRIWVGNGEELLNSPEVRHVPFALLKEVITVNSVPISVLSLTVQSPHQMLLAVGKGSGSFEVWICDIYSKNFDKAGSYDAHDQVVTGLAWAYGGCCLYSCSQDNFVRSWILHDNSLSEAPIPCNILGMRSPTKLPDVFISCLGLVASPGNLVVAMVRNFDLDTLDHMYEARAHKAAVEFFWIGGQKVDAFFKTFPEYFLEAFSEKELACWECNILWSLKQYEDPDKPLVIWDVIEALLAFKRFIPKYVECTMVKWLSTLYLGSHVALDTKEALSDLSKNLSNISSRQLHLLNIICRRVILSELEADEINSKQQKLGGLCGHEKGHIAVWIGLLLNSERELRERLVAISFSAFTSLTSSSTCPQPGHWCADGAAHMKQWITHNHEGVRDQLKVLASEVVEHQRRIGSTKYVEEEKCSYCGEPVPFDSPEVAFCQGLDIDGVHQKHKLVRCAVSMQVCPTSPLWFCKCCHRWTSKLAPVSFFMMPRYPVDLKNLTEYSVQEKISKPLCPFCGILLQRLQPEFLLSASPV